MTENVETSHNERIIDQFTKQAIPFTNAAWHSNESAFKLMMNTTGVSSSDTVLDVACGSGLVSCAFAEVADHVTGIDITPAMIERAKQLQQEKNLKNTSWQIGDVLPLPFPDASFSMVITRYSFHHFLDPQAVLAQMRRVCTPGDKVAVIDVAVEPDKSVAYDTMEKLRDPSHVRALSLAELKALFQEAGLKDLKIESYDLETELEGQLGASFPNEGDADKIRSIFRDDLTTNSLGVKSHVRDGVIYYAYPTAIIVGTKTT